MTSVEPFYARILPRLLLLAGAIFIVATNGMLVAGILPPLGRTFHASATVVGYTITWYSGTVAVLAPVLGIALARAPRRAILAGALLVFASGAVVAASASTLELFVVGRIVSGVGAAAIMPTALAVAATLAPPERRGTALAITGAGFTLAAGLGAPAATALASVGGWRTPVATIAGIAVLLAVVLAVAVRGVPLPPRLRLRERIAPLTDRRLVVALVATLLAIAAFNIVYIYLSAEGRPSIGASLVGLAGLQLVVGIGSLVGSVGVGPLIDRVGSRRAGLVSIGLLAVGAALIAPTEPLVVALVVVLGIWGVAGGAVATPIQHRIVQLDPDRSAIALSWNSSAMYLGIAIAPLLGGAGLALGAPAVPLIAAASAALGFVAFLLGWIRDGSARRPVRTPRTPDPAVPHPAA